MLSSGRHDRRLSIERLLAVAIGLALLSIWKVSDVLMRVLGAVVAMPFSTTADPIGRVLPIMNFGAVASATLLVVVVLGVFTCFLKSGRTRPGLETTGNTP